MAITCESCDKSIPTKGEPGFIWTDGLWTVCTRTNLAGWVNLVANRHSEGFWNLDDEEALAFGIAMRTAGKVMRDVVGAERVYIYWRGEDRVHFQLHMAPRGERGPHGPNGEVSRAEAVNLLMAPLAVVDTVANTFADDAETVRLGKLMESYFEDLAHTPEPQ
jgi:hypothetical protein